MFALAMDPFPDSKADMIDRTYCVSFLSLSPSLPSHSAITLFIWNTFLPGHRERRRGGRGVAASCECELCSSRRSTYGKEGDCESDPEIRWIREKRERKENIQRSHCIYLFDLTLIDYAKSNLLSGF